MTARQKGLIAFALTAAVGAGIYEARQAAQWRGQVRARANQAGETEQLSNALPRGLEMAMRMRMTIAQDRINLMKPTLGLTDAQARLIRELLEKHARRQVAMSVEAMNGKMTTEQRLALTTEESNQANAIKALLSREQLAAYPPFEQAEKDAAADKSANYDAKQIAREFNLSKEQQDQVRLAFYQRSLNEPTKGLNQETVAAPAASGNVEEVIGKSIGGEKSVLEANVKILESILTPEQIRLYRKKGMKRIDMMAVRMKIVLLQKPGGIEK
jgi:hypothetical protein